MVDGVYYIGEWGVVLGKRMVVYYVWFYWRSGGVYWCCDEYYFYEFDCWEDEWLVVRGCFRCVIINGFVYYVRW